MYEPGQYTVLYLNRCAKLRILVTGPVSLVVEKNMFLAEITSFVKLFKVVRSPPPLLENEIFWGILKEAGCYISLVGEEERCS